MLLWLWLLLAIFLMLPISTWAWQHIGFVSFAQFPWRWLMIAALPLAVLAGSAALLRVDPLWAGREASDVKGATDLSDQPDQSLNLSTVLLALLLILGSAPYLRAETPAHAAAGPGQLGRADALPAEQRRDDRRAQWVDLSQRPMWSDMAELYVQADNPPLRPDASKEEQAAAMARQAAAVKTKVDYSQMPQNETLAVDSQELGSAHERLWVHSGAPGQQIVFNIPWFPGWRAYLLDGENGPIIGELPLEREDGPLARIVVPVPEGDNYILLRFEDTPVRTVGKAITAIGGWPLPDWRFWPWPWRLATQSCKKDFWPMIDKLEIERHRANVRPAVAASRSNCEIG